MAKRDVNVFEILNAQLADVSDSDTSGEMQWISLDRIADNALNFYPKPTSAQLEELMESIQVNGLLEPPTVIQNKGTLYYRLISGHSRITALRRLHDREPDAPQYQRVLCRVLPQMDKAQEMTAVIEANRQRVKSDALLAEEAKRLTEAYVKRREAGEDLPGRIRDRVAEAMQISKTKLANLSAIKNGIKVPGIMRSWERDEIPEAAALEIARLPVEAQYRLLDYVVDGHHDYSIRSVKKFALMWNGCQKECPETGEFCQHAEAIYDTDFHGGAWHSPGCCSGCLHRDTCPSVCQYARPAGMESQTAPEDHGGIAPPPKLENRVELSAEDWQVRRERFSQRLRAAREATGLDRAAFAEKIGEYKATYSAWENGNLPGSGAFPRLAQALGVSTDYLYGLTDDPAPKPVPSVLNQNCGNSESKDGMSFGERLRKARKAAGLTQSDLAEKIGRTAQNVNQYELGLRSPKIETAQTFANALGVSVSELLDLPIQAYDFAPRPTPVQWQPLDEDHWPADQQLVILRWDNALGEWCYGTARCVGGYSDLYPFVDTDVGCELEEPSHGEYDAGYWWMPLPEMEDQHESDEA